MRGIEKFGRYVTTSFFSFDLCILNLSLYLVLTLYVFFLLHLTLAFSLKDIISNIHKYIVLKIIKNSFPYFFCVCLIGALLDICFQLIQKIQKI